MRGLGPASHQFAPGGEDDALVFQCLFECRVEHGEHVPAAEGAAVADGGEVGFCVGAVHDHHGHTGLKCLQSFYIFCRSPVIE